MDVIKEVKNLNFPDGEYLIFGSCPLQIHGIRETKDIDIFVSENFFQELRKSGWKEVLSNSDIYLVKDNVEIGKKWNYGDYNPTLEELLLTAEYVDGIPFANLNEVLKWKRAYGREKDLKDVVLIENYLKKHIECRGRESLLR